MTTAYVASTPGLLNAAHQIASDWRQVGVTGHLLARNLDTGEELGFDADLPVPLASVVKVPLALVVLDRIAAGRLDAGTQLTIEPAAKSLGTTGIAAFRHPATVAIGDLLHLMLTVSDNASADALFGLVGVAEADQRLREWGCDGIRLRHRMQRMYESASGVAGDDFVLAVELAIRDEQTGRYVIESLDPAHANTGTPRALVGLLERIWLDRISEPAATAELRRMMGLQLFHQRLASDLRTDTLRVYGKTGTFLHLRHEIGVIETDTGERIAVAALTKSNRRATVAGDIDLSIGTAARTALEHLRAG